VAPQPRPLLEAALLDRAANPPNDEVRIDFDIVDAHRALASLGMHSQRLSWQFQKTLEQLREIQAERPILLNERLPPATAQAEGCPRLNAPRAVFIWS
jgi:hypothetical protein